MKFAIPTNFQGDLISRLDENKKEVCYVYGKLASDFIGGGRPSLFLPAVSKRYLKRYIKEIHENGLEFNYLLNTACLGNKEYTISGQRQIRHLIDWLIDIKVDSVTVAIPYLAQLIKKNYPQLKIYASNLAYVDSVAIAKYWEDLGVDLIVLATFSLNRDFETLSKIRKHVKCKLELIANNACLYRCPLREYHRVTIAHASQDKSHTNGYYIDYCLINCRAMRLSDSVNFIRSDWIRPEDVHYYEEIGIDSMKVVDRSKDVDFILRVTDAYIKRHYDGNLIDIFNLTSQGPYLKGAKKWLRHIRYLLKPFTVNIFSIQNLFKLPPLEVYIDNNKLDGFLEFFVNRNCKGLCEECNYCEEVAKKTVKMDERYQKETISKYKKIIDDIVSGRPFRYF